MSIVDAIYNRKNDLLAALIEEKKQHLSKGKGSKPSAGSLLQLRVSRDLHLTTVSAVSTLLYASLYSPPTLELE